MGEWRLRAGQALNQHPNDRYLRHPASSLKMTSLGVRGTNHHFCIAASSSRLCSLQTHWPWCWIWHSLTISKTLSDSSYFVYNLRTAFTARCYALYTECGIAMANRLSICQSVCPSVTLRYYDHIVWVSPKLHIIRLAPLSSPTGTSPNSRWTRI